MRNIVDQLPPEIAQQLHPHRRQNELDYWAERDRLLTQYRGQWIGYADGQVVAAGSSPVDVFHAAESSGRHPFVICVGREEVPSRIRRYQFAYDTSYLGEPLPLMTIEFRMQSGVPGTLLDRVIADTGADATMLPRADCQHLSLDPSMGMQSLMSGVAGGSMATLAFQIWAQLDGQDFPCRLQADFYGNERILGRDVLNRVEVLFRGPSGELIVNP